jgi:hypothetical protein
MEKIEQAISILNRVISEATGDLFSIIEVRDSLKREHDFMYFCQHGRYPD